MIVVTVQEEGHDRERVFINIFIPHLFLGIKAAHTSEFQTLQIKSSRLGSRLKRKGICLPSKLQYFYLFHYYPEAFQSDLQSMFRMK